MDILLQRTDEEHALSLQEIINGLSDYDIKAERKTIYSDIELLRDYGLDIVTKRSRTFSYFVASRQFELPELKLLVDAVQSSRFITHKKSAELIRKLSSLISIHQAKQLKRQVFVANRPKSVNESVYYSIDAIHSAINERKKISFKYFDYDLNKARVYRKGGECYIHTPVAMCWSDDKYYLICYNEKYDNFNHYRVDRMSDVNVSTEKADIIDKGRFNVAEHSKQVFGMYGGDEVKATLRFDNSLINTVLDRFGTDTPIYKRENSFEIIVGISESPIFLSWMTQFGNRAEIIAPERLRTSMSNLIDELAKKYRLR